MFERVRTAVIIMSLSTETYIAIYYRSRDISYTNSDAGTWANIFF